MSTQAVWWAVGAYLAGTFPSAWLVAVAKRSGVLIASSSRKAGESDPHVLMLDHVGVVWSAVAAALDVLKAFLFVLAARHLGHLDEGGLALTGIAVVVGHTFPFYLRQMAGRGLAAAAGVYLVLLPLEMVLAGLLIVGGRVIRATGLASTVAMASVPVAAAVQGQPPSLVAMAAAVFGVILLRRLEGLREVIVGGVPAARAVAYRCLFDSSGPPSRSPGR